MKTVYVVPWYNCNLNCPHCEVSHRKYLDADFTKFFKELCFHGLEKKDRDIYVLFGGEPLLIRDRFIHIMNTGLIDTVSTNMLLWTEDLAQIFTERGATIATSWNPRRFTPTQEKLWQENIQHAISKGIDVEVLITLTRDLFEMDEADLELALMGMQSAGVKKFLFEPYIGEDECNGEADSWLIDFHEFYSSKHYFNMESEIITKLENWNCDCSKTFTLEPTGRLVKGCPQYKPTQVPHECLTCLKNDVCRPCVLQKTCSYPKEFADWVKERSSNCL